MPKKSDYNLIKIYDETEKKEWGDTPFQNVTGTKSIIV